MRRTPAIIFVFILAFAFLAAPDSSGQEPTIDICLNHINAHPDASTVYDQLGVLYARQNDLTNAERYFRKAVKIDRLYSRGYFNLGVLKLNTGDYNAAMENFITAVTFATDDFQSLINLGNIYNIRNDLNDAFYYYQKAFRLNPGDPDLLNNLGVLALKHKNYAEAVGILSKVWETGKDEDTQLNLAAAYYYSGDKNKIRELYPLVNPQQKHYSTVIQLLER